MDHHPVADINAHMGCATGVVGFLEEDQVSGLCLTLRDNVAFSHQTVGRLLLHSSHCRSVDDPAYKTGAVKTGTRRAAAPNIGITEIFLCFGNHLPEFFIRQSFARNVVILVFSAGTAPSGVAKAMPANRSSRLPRHSSVTSYRCSWSSVRPEFLAT